MRRIAQEGITDDWKWCASDHIDLSASMETVVWKAKAHTNSTPSTAYLSGLTFGRSDIPVESPRILHEQPHPSRTEFSRQAGSVLVCRCPLRLHSPCS